MKQEKFEYDRFFHVYNRGNNEENIFKEEKNIIVFKIPKVSILIKHISFYFSVFTLHLQFSKH